MSNHRHSLPALGLATANKTLGAAWAGCLQMVRTILSTRQLTSRMRLGPPCLRRGILLSEPVRHFLASCASHCTKDPSNTCADRTSPGQTNYISNAAVRREPALMYLYWTTLHTVLAAARQQTTLQSLSGLCDLAGQ